ncbi:MAG: peptide ABC transporter substrate-binding protein [Chloroflexota bacterium]
MKRSLLALVVLALVLALVAAPAMAQDASNTLKIALDQEPDTMNPQYTNMWYATTVQDLILAQAWVIDDKIEPVPVLAQEIPSADNGGLSADGTVITIKLKDGLKWSDGEPLTSADFKFYYDMIMNTANTVSSRAPWDTKVKSVEAPDPQTVVITTNEAYAPWIATLNITPLPMHILQPIFDKDGNLDTADWNRNPTVGSGPYTLVNWESGSEMNFVRNDNYILDPAKIDNIKIQFVPDAQTVVSALIAGDTDVGTFIDPGEVPGLKDSGKVNIESVGSGYNEGIFFNVGTDGNAALKDVNVRKALAMLIDRDKINHDLNKDVVHTGVSFWESTPYANPDLKPVPYDVEGAKKLLDDAGWVDSNSDGTRDKDGVELVLRYVTNQRQVRKDIQAVIKQAYEDVGVGVDIQNFDSDVFFAGYADGGPMSSGQYDMGEYSAAPNFPDPDTQRFTCQQVPSQENPEGNNDNYYCNPDVDKLVAQEASTTDTDTRVGVFHQIDQLLYNDHIWTSMWYDPDLWAINNRISNTNVSGADPLWNIANWTISG